MAQNVMETIQVRVVCRCDVSGRTKRELYLFTLTIEDRQECNGGNSFRLSRSCESRCEWTGNTSAFLD